MNILCLLGLHTWIPNFDTGFDSDVCFFCGKHSKPKIKKAVDHKIDELKKQQDFDGEVINELQIVSKVSE